MWRSRPELCASCISRQFQPANSCGARIERSRFSVRRLRRRCRCESSGARTPFLALLHLDKHQVRRTDLTLSCAARAHVPKPERRGSCRREVACNACRCATAVTPGIWRERRRLGRRAEAGPRQLQREVGRRSATLLRCRFVVRFFRDLWIDLFNVPCRCHLDNVRH